METKSWRRLTEIELIKTNWITTALTDTCDKESSCEATSDENVDPSNVVDMVYRLLGVSRPNGWLVATPAGSLVGGLK